MFTKTYTNIVGSFENTGRKNFAQKPKVFGSYSEQI